MKKLLCILLLCLLVPRLVLAQSDDDYDSGRRGGDRFGDFTPNKNNARHPWWSHVLLWLPNRIMDAVDIFRADIGVGPAVGGVLRVSRYGQVGYRQMLPLSVRAGLMGRRIPFLVEHQNEIGAGPAFLGSSDRKVCPAEIGLGLDIVLLGGYGGICFDEVIDFGLGLFFLDPNNDDLK